MNPVALLGELLATARHRGERFDEAWTAAVPRALECARSGLAARLWADALGATRGAWDDAYHRRPFTPASRACLTIAKHHDLMGGAEIDVPATRAWYVA
jgi:hypothetical protein